MECAECCVNTIEIPMKHCVEGVNEIKAELTINGTVFYEICTTFNYNTLVLTEIVNINIPVTGYGKFYKLFLETRGSFDTVVVKKGGETIFSSPAADTLTLNEEYIVDEEYSVQLLKNDTVAAVKVIKLPAKKISYSFTEDGLFVLDADEEYIKKIEVNGTQKFGLSFLVDKSTKNTIKITSINDIEDTIII